MSFPGSSDGKASACDAGDPDLASGLGRSPGEGNGNPLKYSCLENPVDRGAWRATVHGVTKSGHDRVTNTWHECLHIDLRLQLRRTSVMELNGLTLVWHCSQCKPGRCPPGGSVSPWTDFGWTAGSSVEERGQQWSSACLGLAASGRLPCCFWFWSCRCCWETHTPPWVAQLKRCEAVLPFYSQRSWAFEDCFERLAFPLWWNFSQSKSDFFHVLWPKLSMGCTF